MLPAIISQSVVALKDTALGHASPTTSSRGSGGSSTLYNNPLAVGVTIAAIYVVINYSLSKLAVVVEARQRRVRPRRGSRAAAGPRPS